MGAWLHRAQTARAGRQAILSITLFTVFALVVQGFHPYAEDGGLYVAGIKKVLDPSLFSVRPDFVLAHLRFSPFAAVVAGLTRFTHLPLGWILLLLYCGSVWATLAAGWMVASRITLSEPARGGAVALLASWLTIPVAGTSLMLMDPYVTARSVSTPLTLFAIAFAVDAISGNRGAGILCAVSLTLSIVHPLMAAYALATIVVLLVVGSKNEAIQHRGPAALFAIALVAAAALQAFAPKESPNYHAAAMTRTYWFPQLWQWYELVGLAAPLLLVAFFGRASTNRRCKAIARTALILGLTAATVSAIFCRTSLQTPLVASLQPLRSFQVVYEMMILMLGAWLGERWLKRHLWRWAACLAILGAVMFSVQRSTYPASNHFEFPAQMPRNLWSQAFVWARENTPKDALFALDSHYITHDGEDAQGFRGIAERSALPDYSKDGGETSITPSLADQWIEGQAAQTGLELADDADRDARLRPLGVTWVVLSAAAKTKWTCPYQNVAVKVCRLP